MKVYSAYKESGVDLVGDIPTHWDIAPLKFVGNIVLGKMLTKEDKGGYFEKPYLRAKNIGWEVVVSNDDINSMWFSANELEQYRLEQNDLLISEGGEVGRTAIWQDELEECYIQNSVHKVSIFEEHHPRYYLYHGEFFGKIGYYDSIVNRVSIAHLTREKLKDVRFLVPPLLEQKAIADFLDRKTAQIDTLIEKKQRQIALLEEQRTALINQAVTKGLWGVHGDATHLEGASHLAPRMKDSGIEWLGEIPSHWGVKRLKYLADIKTGERNTEDNVEDGKYPFFVRSQTVEKINSYSFDGEAVLTAGDGVGVAKVFHYINGKFDYHQRVYKFSNFQEVSGRYFFYFVRNFLADEVLKLSAKSTVDSLRLPMLQNFPVPTPYANTQEAIVRYLDQKEVVFKSTVSSVRKQIELLQEYRTALISASVTGKIDVREWRVESRE